MALNVKQKYPSTQDGAAQLYVSDTRLSLRRREQVFTRLSKSYKFVIKLFVFRHQRDQQLYIHLALHLVCLLISSRQCRSHRRLDFFYSNTNNLVQLEDTAIKTESCCSMQCTKRTRVMHHSSLGLHCCGCPDQISYSAVLEGHAILFPFFVLCLSYHFK